MVMKIHHCAACALLGMTSLAAHSQQNTVRIGAAHIMVHAESADFTSNGPAFLTPQPAGVSIGDASTLLLSYSRALDAHWDVELALGVPPSQEVRGRGMLAPFGQIAKVKQLAPTAFLNYTFGASGSKLRPFVGIGVNHTRFYDGESTDAGMLASGGPTKISLASSTGAAGQVGLDYHLDPRWSLHASVIKAKVKSQLTATTGSIERKTEIDFRPIVATLSLGFSF
jgi:outer membrane protein